MSHSRSLSNSIRPENYYVDPVNESVCVIATTLKNETFDFEFMCPPGGFFCDVGYATIGEAVGNQTCHPVSFYIEDCQRNLTAYMRQKCAYQPTCSFTSLDLYLSNITHPDCQAFANATSFTFEFYGVCCVLANTCPPRSSADFQMLNATDQVVAFDNNTSLQMVGQPEFCPFQLKATAVAFAPFIGISIPLIAFPAININITKITSVTCAIAIYLTNAHAQYVANVSFVAAAIRPQLMYRQGCGRYLFTGWNTTTAAIPSIRTVAAACNYSAVPFAEYDVSFTNLLLYNLESIQQLDIVVLGLLPGDFFYIDQISLEFQNMTSTSISISPCLNATLPSNVCACNEPTCPRNGTFRYVMSPLLVDNGQNAPKGPH